MSYVRIQVRIQGDAPRGRDDVRRAHGLFRWFNRFAADRVRRARCVRIVPRVLVQLGRLEGLIYSSDRGRRGRVKKYIHFMETPPILASDPAGRQLYVVGGRYRVTPRGIEG